MIEYINNRFVWRRTTTQGMGKVFADIELLNGEDVGLARNYIIGEVEIRRISIRPQVDTSSDYLCINENIQEVLKLPFVKYKYAELADGRIVKCDVVGPAMSKNPYGFRSCFTLTDYLYHINYRHAKTPAVDQPAYSAGFCLQSAHGKVKK